MNEWIIIAIVAVILLFSAKKLPDMARGLGQSMRIFKAETRGMKEDEQSGSATGVAGSQPAGEVAPGRVAGPGETVTNGTGTNGVGVNGTGGSGTAGAGTTDGAPRAGS